jgi:hypothetical protein
MKRAIALAALVFAALITGCSKEAPVAPPTLIAPKVVTVQPPARSAGYAYDGQIWALFDRPLDPKSIDTTTVFLKKDTQRLACAVSYEPVSRRIVVVPRASLGLNVTYTVVVTTLVRAKDGTPLPQDYLWQFATSSIRRPVYVSPAPGEIASPVTMLRWLSADAAPGSLVFDVYAGPDSNAVAARTTPVLAHTTNSFYLPRSYWPAGQRSYWAVTTTNVATGEKIHSPAVGFQVLPNGTPTHAVSGQAIEWGAIQTGRTTQFCSQNYVPAGPGYNNAVRFDLDPGRMGIRVKSASLVMTPASNPYLASVVSAWYCSPTWFACSMVYTGAPFIDPGGQLGFAYTSGSQMIIESPGLAAWVEGMLRRSPDFSGLMFTCGTSAGNQININTSGPSGPRPVINVVVYD